MALIKTLTELQKFLKINADLRIESFTPYVDKAQQKFIIRYLGKDLLTNLETWYNSPNPPSNPEFTKLLPYVQEPLANFALLLSSADFDIHVGEQGFQIITTGTMLPASTDRVNRFNENRKQLAWDGIEVLLRFLEENKGDYPDWTSSEAYTWTTELLINNAIEFDRCVSIDQSRLQFMKMRQDMGNEELIKIAPVISPELLLEIKTQLSSGNITPENEKLEALLKRALANFTAAIYFEPCEKYRRLAEHYLFKAKKIILDNLTDYPTYTSSETYVPEQTDVNKFNNNSGDPFFVFGMKR